MTFPSINLPYSLLKIHSGNISRSNKPDGFIIFLERYFSIDLDYILYQDKLYKFNQKPSDFLFSKLFKRILVLIFILFF